MISLDRCRQILGPACTMTDDEVEHLRDQLYALADIAIAGFCDTGPYLTGQEGESPDLQESQPKEKSS